MGTILIGRGTIFSLTTNLPPGGIFTKPELAEEEDGDIERGAPVGLYIDASSSIGRAGAGECGGLCRVLGTSVFAFWPVKSNIRE